MSEVKAEIITRKSRDVWIRSQLNGGCGLSGSGEPRYDNQVKAVLKAAEGFIDLKLTENHYDDRQSKFVDASVNFRDKDTNLAIRVDNHIKEREFHYNVEENDRVMEDHTKIPYDSSALPLNFALRKVLEYFNTNYAKAGKPWAFFGIPPVKFLADLLTFNERKIDGATMLPITFLGYPGSQVKIDIYIRITTRVNLVPIGFVVEKK